MMKYLILALILTATLFSLPKIKHVYNDANLKMFKNNANFDTRALKGKIHLIIYADPDQSSSMKKVLNTFKEQKFSKTKVGQVFIVNFKASWIPNAILNSKLKSKQKEDKHFTIVKDLNRTLQRKWNLKNNGVNLILLDKNQKILFIKKGNIRNTDINNAIKIIKNQEKLY